MVQQFICLDDPPRADFHQFDVRLSRFVVRVGIGIGFRVRCGSQKHGRRIGKVTLVEATARV